jgi:hypothetical protein
VDGKGVRNRFLRMHPGLSREKVSANLLSRERIRSNGLRAVQIAFDESAAGQITRQSHAAKTSSRTKCKRITFGRSASSK